MKQVADYLNFGLSIPFILLHYKYVCQYIIKCINIK